jgi:hypothetical protein
MAKPIAIRASPPTTPPTMQPMRATWLELPEAVGLGEFGPLFDPAAPVDEAPGVLAVAIGVGPPLAPPLPLEKPPVTTATETLLANLIKQKLLPKTKIGTERIERMAIRIPEAVTPVATTLAPAALQ